MGSLMTKAQLEAILDTIAAQLATEAAAFRTSRRTPTAGSLYSQVDAIGDPDIELALLDSAHTQDNRLFDENGLLSGYLGNIHAPLLQALNTQAQRAGYQTLDGACTQLGAKVSPLLQSIARATLGRSFTPANAWSPALAPGAYDAVYAGAEGSLVDLTAAAADATTADVDLFTNQNELLYLGLDNKPTVATDHLAFQLSTLATLTCALTWQYWNGSAWATLTQTDAATTGTYGNCGTKNMTQRGVVSYTVPTDWSRTNLNTSGSAIISSDLTPRYYLRVKRTAGSGGMTNTPVASMLQHGIGLGLVLVTGTNLCTFVAGAGVDSTLYAPLTKLQLRALTSIGANVTATLTYTNQSDASVSQAQSAWSSIDAGDVYDNTGSYLALNGADTGVKAATGVAVSTTATSGAFCIESVPLRTPAA